MGVAVGTAAAILATPVLVLLLWSVVRAARGVRRYRGVMRSYQGLCGSCGYDLRDSPARCPECGEPSRWTLERRPSSR